MNLSEKIVLGTVQFGLDYGICNNNGQTSLQETKDILLLAHQNGIQTLDTAFLYGNSEKSIGRTGMSDKFSIITKTPHFSQELITDADVEKLESTFFESSSNLQTSPHAILIHNANDLLKKNGDKLYNKLKQLKQNKYISKIGISVYDTKQCEELMNRYELDIVQLPMSVFDQNFMIDGTIQKLASHNIEIHVRSVFLQGLLLQKSLPLKFNSIKKTHSLFKKKCASLQKSQLSIALNFISSINQIDKLVIGVNDTTQLSDILSVERFEVDPNEFSDFHITQSNITNPSQW